MNGLLPFDGVAWPRLLALGLGVSLLTTVLVVAGTSTAAFGSYNPSWDGTSDFRGDLEAEENVEADLVRDPDVYETVEPDGTVAFVIAPEPHDGDDIERIARFVEDGGTLVVLESFDDGGNVLLAAVGAEARLDGRLVRDDLEHDSGPTMPLAGNVTDHELTEGVGELTLNHGTAVEPGNATVLVTTGEFASLHERGDDPAEIEEFAAYPVATVEDVGDGEVIVVSDPSLTINAMVDRADNGAFLRNAYAGEERVLLEAGSEDVPPLVGAVLTIRETPWLQVLVGLLAVGTVGAASSRRLRSGVAAVRGWVGTDRTRAETIERGREPGLSEDEQVEFLQRRYPEWADERIRRVVKAINRTGVERGDE
ncbi:DUF4350 domain-containing protein [Natrialbaceae archaeon A-gly3]